MPTPQLSSHQIAQLRRRINTDLERAKRAFLHYSQKRPGSEQIGLWKAAVEKAEIALAQLGE